MARSLVIVESPAKAKTINKYLGREYVVKASLGHVLDLPRKTLGILLPGSENGKKKKKKRKTKAKGKEGEKVEEKKPPKPVVVTAENIFEPTLEIIPGKIKVIADLRKAADVAPNVYLATDPDREGEAISQHLLDTLATKKSDRAKYRRVMFNEITPKAIKAAFAKAGDVNSDLVDAQQARRVLDRLVSDLITNSRKLIGESGVESVEAVRQFPQRLFSFSSEVDEERKQIKEFLYQNVYYSPAQQRDKQQAEKVIAEMFAFFIKSPRDLPASYQEKTRSEPLHRIVCDYVAGMTDSYIFEQHRRFCGAKKKVPGLSR